MDTLDVILTSKSDSQLVLDRLRDIIHDCGFASVSDYYDLLGVTGSFTDQYWGWTDLYKVEIVNAGTNKEWKLELPHPDPIK